MKTSLNHRSHQQTNGRHISDDSSKCKCINDNHSYGVIYTPSHGGKGRRCWEIPTSSEGGRVHVIIGARSLQPFSTSKLGFPGPLLASLWCN